MEARVCKECGAEKYIVEFRQMPSGNFDRTCKRCRAKAGMDRRNWRKENEPGYIDLRRSQERSSKATFRKKNPDYIKTNNEVARMIKRKEIELKDYCEFCGATLNLEAHHENPKEKYKITTLCKKCHRDRDYYLNIQDIIDEEHEGDKPFLLAYPKRKAA
jgi:hypothetical protein